MRYWQLQETEEKNSKWSNLEDCEPAWGPRAPCHTLVVLSCLTTSGASGNLFLPGHEIYHNQFTHMPLKKQHSQDLLIWRMNLIFMQWMRVVPGCYRLGNINEVIPLQLCNPMQTSSVHSTSSYALKSSILRTYSYGVWIWFLCSEWESSQIVTVWAISIKLYLSSYATLCKHPSNEISYPLLHSVTINMDLTVK